MICELRVKPTILYKADGGQTAKPHQALPNGKATLIHTHHICPPEHMHTHTPPTLHTYRIYPSPAIHTSHTQRKEGASETVFRSWHHLRLLQSELVQFKVFR